MDQNTDKWLEWRRKGLGASDAPIILGVSPWKTPYQLWEEKLGLTKSVGNFATQRGHDLEPKARASFELEVNDDFPDTLATHNKLEWLRASLDGYNKDRNAILEIKCPGKDDHETARNGSIPLKYWPQIQHQFLVTGAELCYYYSFDGENGVIVEATPDLAYIEDHLFPRLVEFWEQVTTKTPPAFTDKDQIKITDEGLLVLADEYAKADDQIKTLQTKQKEIKKRLEDGISHPKAKVGRLAFTRSVSKGSVDYKKIPQLDGVDVEEFRKEPISKTTIRVGK